MLILFIVFILIYKSTNFIKDTIQKQVQQVRTKETKRFDTISSWIDPYWPEIQICLLGVWFFDKFKSTIYELTLYAIFRISVTRITVFFHEYLKRLLKCGKLKNTSYELRVTSSNIPVTSSKVIQNAHSCVQGEGVSRLMCTYALTPSFHVFGSIFALYRLVLFVET